MDISKKAVNPTSVLHLRDASDELMYSEGPDGDPCHPPYPVQVVLYGPGSREFEKAQARQNNLFIAQLKRKGKVEQTSQQKREEASEFLTAITESFKNMEYKDLVGEDMARAVYMDISIGFIADQVTAHVKDWANFTKG